MKKPLLPEWFNGNLIAVAILLVAYAFSIYRFVHVTRETQQKAQEEDANATRIVRVTHWQLEPGFREAFQWAIDQYNALPHVREAKVEVRQLPITERVFTQFMNVHLISGTAPDIATRGKTQLIQGNALARFFAPLGSYVGEPNPYNAPARLDASIDPTTRDYLATAPWSDTFVDGMEGGFDPGLQDYYAVPVSVWGGLRLFYNMDLLEQVKSFVRENIEHPTQPEWLQKCWLREVQIEGEEGTHITGYLKDTPELRQWLEQPENMPQTLGQLLLFCRAVEAYAKTNHLSRLVPISGSNYTPGDLSAFYQRSFLNYARDKNDWDRSGVVSDLETIAGRQVGLWSFTDDVPKQYFQFASLVTSFYPRGYLGLDREQAQRRFVMGNAAIISSGAWDASALFQAVASRREGGFPIAISRPPYPAPGERWADILTQPPSEANFTTGVPLAINRASPNFEWALDFLRFVSSQPINQEMNQRAGWLPAIVGARPSEAMAPFAPVAEGKDGRGSLAFGTGFLQNTFTGQSKILLSGDIDYPTFVARMEEALSNPRHGADAFWQNAFLRSQDRTLSDEAMLNALRVRQNILADEKADTIFRSWITDRFPIDQGKLIRWFWHALYPDKPFPANE